MIGIGWPGKEIYPSEIMKMKPLMLCTKCFKIKPDNYRDSCDDCFLEQRLGKEIEK